VLASALCFNFDALADEVLFLNEQRCSDSVKNQLSEIQLKLEEDEEPMTSIAGNVMETGAGVVGAVDTGAQ
jgi:hypothetical protein